MNSWSCFTFGQEESTSDVSQKEKSDDPTIDLFPDDDNDERGRKYSFYLSSASNFS